MGHSLGEAQLICLRLPFCYPGFESQAHYLCFYQFIFELCQVEKTKINKREATAIAPWHLLQLWVWIPITPCMLFSICIIENVMRKGLNKIGLAHLF